MGYAISRISLVMQDQNVEIQPIPRNLAPGQTATLSGTLLGKLTNPKVRYTDAVGKLEQPPAQPGKAFSADIKCGDRPGRILVQVVGQPEGADLPVAPLPLRPRNQPPPPPPRPPARHHPPPPPPPPPPPRPP